MLTPNGGLTAYCTPATFLSTYDWRLVGQLARSDGTQATATELLTDPVLAHALAAASGEVELACMAGGRYAAADLAALAGNGAAILAGLVADLAFGRMKRLRGARTDDLPQHAEALATIERLRGGQEVFPFAEAEAAGLAAVGEFTPSDYLRLNRITDHAARFFGVRLDSGWPGGCGGGRW